MTSVGSIELIAKIDTSQYKKGAKEIERANEDIEDSSSRTEKKGTNSFAQLGKGVAKGIGIATVAVTAFAAAATTVFLKSAVESASQVQSIRASFESLTGSAETARTIIGDLNRFSLETAFSNDQINSASRTLLGFGVSADNLLTVMRQLGDIAGATGGDLSALALVTGQVFAQGRLQAQDYYQIINSGAGTLAAELRKVVKEKTGLNDIKEAFEDGLVTADMYAEALRRSNAAGGFAFEGAIKQSKTFEGRVSNLQEGITNIGLAIIGVDRTTGDVQIGGLFDNLSKAVSAATIFIDENKEEIVAFINGAIVPLGQALSITIQAVQELIRWMQPLLDYVFQNQKVMEVLKITLIAIGAIMLGALLVAIGAVIVVLVALTATVELLIMTFEWLMQAGINTFNWIKNNWKLLLSILVYPFSQAASFIIGHFDSIRRAIGNVWDWARGVFGSIGGIAAAIVKAPVNAIIGWAQNTINGFIDQINRAIGAINNIPGVNIGSVGRVSIPYLAEGGIVTGPTLAMIGEGKESEAVIPLSKLDSMINGNSNTSNVEININMTGIMSRSRSDERQIAKNLIESVNQELRARQLPEIGGGALRGTA